MSEYLRVLNMALVGSGIGQALPLVRWIGKRLPFQVCRDLWQGQALLRQHSRKAVDNMKARRETTNIFANVMAEAEKGEHLDDEDVNQEAANLIVAGSDTTSVSLTYLVWAVLSEPTLQKRVEAEVRTLPEDYTDSDVEQLELVNAVIDETLRLYGAASGGLPRVVPSGGMEIQGKFIPEGSVVETQTYTMHRDPRLFPDPLR